MTTLLQDPPARTAPGRSGSPERAPLGGLGRIHAGEDARKAKAPDSHEYLTFRLGGEEYGIDILKVQEIRSYEQPTKIANAPVYLKGVVNLRGVIVPVVDLRIKFQGDFATGDLPIDSTTVVIVLNVRNHVVGVVVDAVSDVTRLVDSAIHPAPQMSSTVIDTSYIIGIANMNERMLILMDIESLMSSADMGLISQAGLHVDG